MPAADYRKRVVEVRALQFTGDNLDEVLEFSRQYSGRVEELAAEPAYESPDGTWGQAAQPRRLRVWNGEGGRILSEGTWLVVSLSDNELYVRSDEEFQKTYELIS